MADSWSSAATIACGSGAQDCKTRENVRHVPGLRAASSCSVSQNVWPKGFVVLVHGGGSQGWCLKPRLESESIGLDASTVAPRWSLEEKMGKGKKLSTQSMESQSPSFCCLCTVCILDSFSIHNHFRGEPPAHLNYNNLSFRLTTCNKKLPNIPVASFSHLLSEITPSYYKPLLLGGGWLASTRRAVFFRREI